MKRWLRGLILIIRPINVVISMISILMAVVICNSQTSGWVMVLATLVGGFMAGGANAINDYFDLEIDRINRPERPLPGGLLSRQNARTISFCFSCFALVGAALINWYALAITVFSAVLLYFYSAHLKRTAVWGNLAVSVSTGLAFIFGGVVAGNLRNAIIPAIFSFFVNWAREIIKDIEDIPGDQKLNARTLPILYGIKTAKKLTTLILGILLLVTIFAYVKHIYGIYYFMAVMSLVNSLILYVLVCLWQDPDQAGLRRMSTLLKTAMFTGLVAILLGQFK
jgi:geranylgeranylglycerol-phosphate geranylgeranyltransferase